MIPALVPRRQLLAANGLFTLTLNAAFALGFALLGPLVVTLAGPNALILIVAASYLIASALCVILPASPPPLEAKAAGSGVSAAEHAIGTTIAQLREGIDYIRGHRSIGWSLIYLGITASLIGVLGVLGPDFATDALGLAPKDFVVVVLPMGFGIVTGILLLNAYGRLLPRRRVIEAGLLSLGLLLMILSVARRLVTWIQGVDVRVSAVDLSAVVSLLAIVVGIAFLAGIAYAVVAIPSQTQLQEDLPEEVRGRVFGILNMLVSVASFVPIIIVGPISDVVGTSPVIFSVGLMVAISGFASIALRGPLKLGEPGRRPADEGRTSAPVDPIAVALDIPISSTAGAGAPTAGRTPAAPSATNPSSRPVDEPPAT
jgi:hypothetical protein